MFGKAKQLVRRGLDRYPEWLCRREFEEQQFKRFNERPVEFAYVFKAIATYYPRTVLDVGTGTTALPHLIRNCGCLVTAVDNVRDYWPAGMTNRHYHVIHDDITRTQLKGPFDLITCVSVLEHIVESEAAISSMWSVLAPGGHLLLTCPYSETTYVPHVYALPGSAYGQDAPYRTQSYSRQNMTRWLELTGGRIVDQEYWNYWTGDYWTVGQQVIPPQKVTAADRHQLTCVVLEK